FSPDAGARDMPHPVAWLSDGSTGRIPCGLHADWVVLCQSGIVEHMCRDNRSIGIISGHRGMMACAERRVQISEIQHVQGEVADRDSRSKGEGVQMRSAIRWTAQQSSIPIAEASIGAQPIVEQIARVR